nr:hypothetical protein [Tanacetum cinerariifolium]
YIPESDPDEDPEDDDDEDPEEDPADYPADHDDEEKEDEPSRDDADEEHEEKDKDDDDEEEEHPASADSIPPPPALRVTDRISFRPQPPTLADRPDVTLPPRKRLNIVHCLGYEARESSVAAAARSMEGRRADYRFVDSVEAEIRRWRAEDIGYGIRDTWIDSIDVAEEEALTTLEEGRQTKIFQRVEALVDDRLSLAVHFELQGYMTYTWVHDQRIDVQDTLIETLTIQLSSLQGHLAIALGEIRVLQTREQARVGAPEGAGSST